MPHRIEIKWPKRVYLEDGREVTLDSEEEIMSHRLACLISKYDVDKVYKALRELGFRRVPALPLGEKYSLAKIVREPFEMHIRVFKIGLILSEIEISRKYVEHLYTPSVNASLETYELLQNIGADPKLIYLGVGVKEVPEIILIEIRCENDPHPYGSIVREILRSIKEIVMPQIPFSLQQLQEEDEHLG
ncbi:MAG: hypothetical protein GXO23_04960 [Crenarchaeota archaeon]|nr:hypothetical protein [Thermoproteota archaeon]